MTALLGRVAVGAVFLAHGLQKWDMGLDGVTNMVSGMGIPLPALTALFLMAVETVGAVAFTAGAALPVLGVLFAIDMIGAIFFVHIDAGLTGQGGYELVLVLGAAALALGFNGGRLSPDHLVVPCLLRARLTSPARLALSSARKRADSDAAMLCPRRETLPTGSR